MTGIIRREKRRERHRCLEGEVVGSLVKKWKWKCSSDFWGGSQEA